MTRRVFFSFHYQRDAWRASQVRNIGVIEGNASATDNKWEEVKRGGDAAIRRWIDEQLTGRSCTIVLVGAETADRQWVKYEIEKSWNDGNKGRRPPETVNRRTQVWNVVGRRVGLTETCPPRQAARSAQIMIRPDF